GDQRWLTRHELELDEITRPKNFALGLHARGRFDKILDIDACYLQSPRSVEILNCVRQFVLQSKIPPYSTRHHAGFWRHLVIREGKNTGETMINLVTAESPEGSKVVDELASQLSKQFQDITTIVHNINRKRAQVAIGDEERVLFGPGTIQERIGDCLFQISAHSFLQTNTKAAEFLYNKIVEFADFNGDETVYDLYSGAGTIALYCANKVEKVVGFEVLENAVKDAERNCHLNDVENCFFIQGDLKDAFELNSDNTAKSAPPNTIIMDPPRAGLHANVLNNVLNLHPEKMVYVSCNPATFARDAKELCTQQYQLNRVQPVDMFPMTSHIELVSLFTRNPR
ncbi:MAG: 23S rRNA (uracil(1939)-C(5))-methyltransferase RlmD, partial [bacterium]